MVQSKGWDWDKAIDKIWLEPSEESYFYAKKWHDEDKKSILDLGCGLGRHSMLFAKSGFTVTAADISDSGVNYLRQWMKSENLDFRTVVCDMKKLPFSDCAFDCIWAYHVLSHSDTDGIYQIFSEIKRVLKPDGVIYFDLCSKETWTYTSSGFPKLDENTVVVQGGTEDGIPHFFADRNDIEKILAGFSIEKIRHVDDCFEKGEWRLSKHYYIEAKALKSPFIPDYSDIIGKTVKCTIDRPLGSAHPRHNDMIYPINYGYVNGIIGGDNAEQDVYILGIDKPVDIFTGKIIAVFHRYNDIEDKWIAVPEGMHFSDEEILKQINFTEKFFDGKLYR